MVLLSDGQPTGKQRYWDQKSDDSGRALPVRDGKREMQEREWERQEAESMEGMAQEIERTKLAAQRSELEAKKKRLANGGTALSAIREIGRDGPFIAYNDGTVLDTQTNLMWAAKDNRENITWQNAKSYCENYRVGGYKDWRMPTVDELARLYDRSKARQYNESNVIHVATVLINMTSDGVWSSETRGSKAAEFWFGLGCVQWLLQSYDYTSGRALPVRTGK